MKVIKNAMTEPIEITCPECGSVIEYTYQDIKRREDTVFVYYTQVKKYIVCPVCKTDIDVRPKVEVQEAEKHRSKQLYRSLRMLLES